MRHVVKTDMVAHLWAKQSQSDARNSQRNFSFVGETLRSYSTDIAKLYTVGGGTEGVARTVALFSERRYSMTTARHLSMAGRALHDAIEFTVPYCRANSDREHLANRDFLFERAQGLVEHYKRRLAIGTVELDSALESVNVAYDQSRQYAELFGLEVTPQPDHWGEVLVDAQERREARLLDPKYNERMAAARERREAAKREAERKAEAEVAARMQADIARWRSGEAAYSWSIRRAPCMLRVHAGDGETQSMVETSWGAEVPLSHARRVYTFYATFRREQPAGEWRRGARSGAARDQHARQLQAGQHRDRRLHPLRLSPHLCRRDPAAGAAAGLGAAGGGVMATIHRVLRPLTWHAQSADVPVTHLNQIRREHDYMVGVLRAIAHGRGPEAGIANAAETRAWMRVIASDALDKVETGNISLEEVGE